MLTALEAIPVALVAAFAAVLGSLLTFASVCGGLWANRRLTAANAAKSYADAVETQRKTINELVAQLAELQERFAFLTKQVADAGAVAVLEIEGLRRQLGTRADELADVKKRLDLCEQYRHEVQMNAESAKVLAAADLQTRVTNMEARQTQPLLPATAPPVANP